MSRKQRIIISITGIVLVSLILIGLTYGYYLTKIKGNTNSKSISVVTANLLLEYADVNDDLITDSAVELGKSWTKTFVATNKGNKTVTYGVALENVVNTLERKQDLVYTLDCKQYSKTGFSIDKTNKTVTGTISGTCNGVSDETTFPSIGTILVQNDIADDKAQVYTLTITYKEMNVDQSVDMNKTFSAKANIVDPNTFGAFGSGTLTSTIYKSAETKANGTELVNTPKTLPAQATSSFIYLKGTDPTSFTSTLSNATNYYISYADDYTVNETTGKFTLVNPTVATAKYTTSMVNSLVGKYAVWGTTTPTTSNTQNQSSIYKISTNVSDITSTIKYAIISSTTKSTEKELSSTPDDYGTSYYYRGGVEDNYINFAGMCWKIVRIEGDGSTKLILEDRSAECNSSSYTGNWSDGNSVVFGYDSINKANFLNYSGGLADSLKSFQTTLSSKLTTGKSLNDYLKVDDWCYDYNVVSTNSYGYDDNYNTVYEQDKATYGWFVDEYYGAYKRIDTDKNPSLKCTGTKLNEYRDNTNMYVGTLTADEMSFAGATGSTNYTHYLMNNYAKSNYLSWWGLSPSIYDAEKLGGNGSAFRLVSDGSLGYYFDVSDVSFYSRSAVTLLSSTIIKTGNGTKSNPYTVE